jgi:hypothetical protein
MTCSSSNANQLIFTMHRSTNCAWVQLFHMFHEQIINHHGAQLRLHAYVYCNSHALSQIYSNTIYVANSFTLMKTSLLNLKDPSRLFMHAGLLRENHKDLDACMHVHLGVQNFMYKWEAREEIETEGKQAKYIRLDHVCRQCSTCALQLMEFCTSIYKLIPHACSYVASLYIRSATSVK